MGARRTATQMTALTAKSSLQGDVMVMNRLLCHAHEGMVKDIAKVVGITMTGEWKPYVGCSKAKAHQFKVPKTTNECADEPLGRVFYDIAVVMKHPSVGRGNFVVIFVDDYGSSFCIRRLTQWRL